MLSVGCKSGSGADPHLSAAPESAPSNTESSAQSVSPSAESRPASPSPQSQPTAESGELVTVQITERLSAGAVEVLLSDSGLTLERQAIWFDGQPATAWRVRVGLPGLSRVASADVITEFSAFHPRDDGPWATINGGFYDRDLTPMGLVVSDGHERSTLRPGGGSGVFLETSDGPRIVHRSEPTTGATQALQSIDRLVDAGASVVNSTNERRAARSAVVVGSDSLWLVLVAADASVRSVPDGIWLRWTSRRGLPLYAFATYLVFATDAVTALNLDGGPSSSLTVRAAGQMFRVIGERGTINALQMRPAAF